MLKSIPIFSASKLSSSASSVMFASVKSGIHRPVGAPKLAAYSALNVRSSSIDRALATSVSVTPFAVDCYVLIAAPFTCFQSSWCGGEQRAILAISQRWSEHFQPKPLLQDGRLIKTHQIEGSATKTVRAFVIAWPSSSQGLGPTSACWFLVSTVPCGVPWALTDIFCRIDSHRLPQQSEKFLNES